MVTAVETAGRAVVLSGLTVAIGLLALVVLPVPGLRSTGIGGMLIPLVSILVVDTLLPALLGGVGPRVDWPRVRKEARASRAWSAWAAASPGAASWPPPLALAVLVLAIFPVFGLKVGETCRSALSKDRPGPRRPTPPCRRRRARRRAHAHGGAHDPGRPARSAARPSGACRGIDRGAPPRGRAGSRRGHGRHHRRPPAETVNNTTLAPGAGRRGLAWTRPGVIGVTGEGPVQQDYSHAVFGHFPLDVRPDRPRHVPAAGPGVPLGGAGRQGGAAEPGVPGGHFRPPDVVLAGRPRLSAIFGIPATGAITFWVPLMVFAFLFGLSMDYEVFILTRVREEYDRTGNTNDAVVEGLGRTGRLVTCAALILFLAFASLASAPDTDIKVLATGLGPAYSSTRPWCGACSCRPWWRCSGAGTGGCPTPLARAALAARARENSAGRRGPT